MQETCVSMKSRTGSVVFRRVTTAHDAEKRRADDIHSAYHASTDIPTEQFMAAICKISAHTSQIHRTKLTPNSPNVFSGPRRSFGIAAGTIGGGGGAMVAAATASTPHDGKGIVHNHGRCLHAYMCDSPIAGIGTTPQFPRTA